MKRSVFLVLILLVALATSSTNSLADFCTQCQLSCAGTHWVALPTTTTNLKRAEDFCAVDPNRVVSVQKASIKGNFTYHCPTSQPPPPIACTDPTGSGIQEVGSPSCSSNCFCVYPGEGFAVTVSNAVTIPISYAQDDPVNITLEAVPQVGPPGDLMSLPYQRTLASFQDVCDLTGGTSGLAQVRRFNTCTGVTYTYVCGNPQPFALPSACEALVFRDSTERTYANPVTPGSPSYPPCTGCPPSVMQKYCIAGQADNEGYSWAIDLGQNGLDTSDPYMPHAPGVATGLWEPDLALAFAASINGLGFPCVSAVADNDCFTVSAPMAFDLYVGGVDENPPRSKVTKGGVIYNPVITLGEIARVPTLSEWGLIVLLVALMSTGVVFIVRRRSKLMLGSDR